MDATDRIALETEQNIADDYAGITDTAGPRHDPNWCGCSVCTVAYEAL